MKRISNIHTYLVSAALSVLFFVSCSGSADKASPEDLSAASEIGRQRALEFTPDAIKDTFQIESKLIDIRERENRLRSGGMNSVADAYISSFLATLDSVNPSLASELRR